MKKLVFMFAIMLGLSFVSCKDNQNTTEAQENTAVEATVDDSTKVKDDTTAHPPVEQAPAEETQETEAAK
ncbi:hypothetical protein [Sodaliphilus sp.]|uniref:hypothetical protein n=1 Tax=Sodaliphilus sp. TaxID=2815818 RepID=UPI00388D8736